MNRILKITKALSDRNRLRIVMALNKHNELCACHITELLNVAGATASRHLGLLVSAGILKSRKNGRWVSYWIQSSHTNDTIIEWLKSEMEMDSVQ